MIEKAYIGCLVSGYKQTDEMLAAVDPGDLQSRTARAVYTAVQGLRDAGREIDPVVVIAEAGEAVRDYVTEALTRAEFEHAGAWEEHARLITERAQLARAQALGLRLTASVDMQEAREAYAEIDAAMDDRDTRDDFDMADCVREAISAMCRKPDYISTGFSSLDRHLMVSPGDFLIVGGRPSSGKTAFTLQIAAHMAKTRKVVYFSLETDQRKLTERMLSNLGGVELELIKRRSFENNDEVFRRIAAAGTELKTRKMSVIRAAGYDVGRIAAKAQRLRADVIFIDYLGLVRGEGKDRYEKVTNISVALHTLAQRTGIAVFALCQLNRASAAGKPAMHDLRESGQIEQDADAVLLLDYKGARANPQTTEHTVDVAKNKDGRTGELDFRFYGETQRFYAEDRR